MVLSTGRPVDEALSKGSSGGEVRILLIVSVWM